MLKDDIKNKKFQNIYLFYGSERYLIEVYKNRLKKSVFEDVDALMNYDYYTMDNYDESRIVDSLTTMPFMADYRMVVLDKLGFFEKKQEKKLQKIKEELLKIGEDVIVILMEESVDKRSKLFKSIKEKNGAHEFAYMNESALVTFIGTELKKKKKQISTKDASYLIETVGYEMHILDKEIGKLIDYTGEHEIVRKEDIDSICTKHIEGKIFELVDAIGNKNKKRALDLLSDMVEVKEPITRILFMVSRQMRILYETKIMVARRSSKEVISKELKVPPFVVNKLIRQSERFEIKQLKGAIKDLVEVEFLFKSGKIDLLTGLEMFIMEI